MNRLTTEQQVALTSVWPLVRRIAARRGARTDPTVYDTALDGAIRAVRTYDASIGMLTTWAGRNAKSNIARRRERLRVPATRLLAVTEPGYRRVELRDEVEHHMSRATPRQRRAMLAFMSGEPSHTDRAAIQSYRRTLRGTHPTRRRRAGQ